MKKTVLAFASMLALGAGGAQAQTNVTLYGLVDTGVEYVNSIGADDDSVVRMPTLAGSFASRWGFRGTEDLGGGLKANFVLESGFGADSGVFQQGNRIFGRQLFVGLSGGWGAVTMGRQYSQLLFTQIKTDLFLASVYGPGAFELFLAAPRVDNSIAYNGKFGGLTLGALYSFGRDNNGSAMPACAGEAPGDSDNCSSWSANFIYEGTGWGIGGWADEQNNALGQGDQRYSVNGYYTLGKLKLLANVMQGDNDAVGGLERTLWSVGASYPITDKISLEGMYYDYDVDDSGDDSQMLVLRANYAFSKRTTSYLYMGHIMNDGAATRSASIGVVGSTPTAPGESQTAVMIGLLHRF